MKSLNAKAHIENRKIKILSGEIYRSQITEIGFILKSGMFEWEEVDISNRRKADIVLKL